MTRVLTPDFRAPAQVRVGADGIPDFVAATRGSPYFYAAPPGYRLVVTHNRTPLRFVVEADRRRGWAVGFHYTVDGDTTTVHRYDENGVAQHRFYEGEIAFRLEPLS